MGLTSLPPFWTMSLNILVFFLEYPLAVKEYFALKRVLCTKRALCTKTPIFVKRLGLPVIEQIIEFYDGILKEILITSPQGRENCQKTIFKVLI